MTAMTIYHEQCCSRFVAAVFAGELKDITQPSLSYRARKAHLRMWFDHPHLSALVELALGISAEHQREQMDLLIEGVALPLIRGKPSSCRQVQKAFAARRGLPRGVTNDP